MEVITAVACIMEVIMAVACIMEAITAAACRHAISCMMTTPKRTSVVNCLATRYVLKSNQNTEANLVAPLTVTGLKLQE
jgi:hypothetical protein